MRVGKRKKKEKKKKAKIAITSGENDIVNVQITGTRKSFIVCLMNGFINV